MNKKLVKLLASKKGEGYIDTIVLVLVVTLFLAFILNTLPIFIAKFQLNYFANEIVRVAERTGRTGVEVTEKIDDLKENTGLDPTITWTTNYISSTNHIQINEDITAIISIDKDLGFFTFGSFPITLKSKAIGNSEVYWK